MRLNRPCRGQGYGDDDDDDDSLGVRVPEQTIYRFCDIKHYGAPATTTTFQPLSPASSDQYEVLPITNIQHGTIDPFDSLCVSKPSYQTFNYLLHFASQIWTVFSSSDGKNDFGTLKLDAIRTACANKAVWTTFSYAGASHQAFLRSSTDQGHESDLDPVRLNLKQDAIRALIDATKSALDKDEISDWFLSALLTMASHGLGDSVKREPMAPAQSRKPRISISCAEYYDALELTTEHRNAFFTLLEKRGGIHAIENTALRNAIIRFGIYTSYRTLEAPRFERIQPLQSLSLSLEQGSTASTEYQIPGLAFGFFDLFRNANPDLEADMLLKITQALAAITRDQRSILSVENRRSVSNIHELLNHDDSRRTPDFDPKLIGTLKMRLIWNRCVTMWELLSLADRSQAVIQTTCFDEAVLVYELCRIACLMYFQMWIWVISSAKINLARQLLSKMLPLLAASLQPSAANGIALHRSHPRFFLWVMVLSVVMAYEDYEQTGDDSTIQGLLPYLKRLPARPRPDAWSTIASSLENFLWSNQDCDELGRNSWAFVCSFC